MLQKNGTQTIVWYYAKEGQTNEQTWRPIHGTRQSTRMTKDEVLTLLAKCAKCDKKDFVLDENNTKDKLIVHYSNGNNAAIITEYI